MGPLQLARPVPLPGTPLPTQDSPIFQPETRDSHSHRALRHLCVSARTQVCWGLSQDLWEERRCPERSSPPGWVPWGSKVIPTKQSAISHMCCVLVSQTHTNFLELETLTSLSDSRLSSLGLFSTKSREFCLKAIAVSWRGKKFCVLTVLGLS